MEPDFAGWATKAGIRCADGRTIMPNAFSNQDKATVPLVWQHGHGSPKNVIGHAVLEARPEGVYAYGFFNDTAEGKHAKSLVVHKDIDSLSIWANGLIEKAKQVMHGVIREVSLVLSGANPGAKIEHITIAHGDGGEVELEDEAIIFTGLELEHSASPDVDLEAVAAAQAAAQAAADAEGEDEDLSHAADGETVQDIFNTLSDKQKNVVYFMIGQALEDNSAAHSDLDDDDDPNNTDADPGNQEGNDPMSGTVRHSVFDQSPENQQDTDVLTHDALVEIAELAPIRGSLKMAVKEYALSHGIENIDVMFPDAQNVQGTPDWLARRVEWVGSFLGSTHKTPFSRIKSIVADITEDEARAKGYITGAFKKEEFFSVAKRTTSPTTVYKKQKLDRDDVIDITDYDVITWMKGEMRVMLDEEVARAALIGDGRDISSEDKIDEQCIRPIATDNELYAPKIYVNLDDANSSITELIDEIILNRHLYKGTGMPNFYTTETVIAKFLTLKDSLGRRIYNSLDEIAVEIRCASVVPVEVMEEDPTTVGIIVNPIDYTFGTDRGGEVSLFDDFDIDYNQLKYLIETRASGALTKPKSALVLKKTTGTNVLVVPTEPGFVVSTGVITIPTVTGVTYKNGAGTTLSAGAQTALADGASLVVNAFPNTGYYFETSEDDSWEFTRDAGA